MGLGTAHLHRGTSFSSKYHCMQMPTSCERPFSRNFIVRVPAGSGPVFNNYLDELETRDFDFGLSAAHSRVGILQLTSFSLIE